jgi:hypothetical protein
LVCFAQMTVKNAVKPVAPKVVLSNRREHVLALNNGESCFIYEIDIKVASKLVAWVKAFRPARRYTSATEDGGVRIWRIH